MQTGFHVLKVTVYPILTLYVWGQRDFPFERVLFYVLYSDDFVSVCVVHFNQNLMYTISICS